MRTPVLFLLVLPFTGMGQVLTPTVLTSLSPELSESSGLLFTNGTVWTHMDSGGPNALYRIDPNDGTILRTVTVSNATHVDWEDLTASNGWLYLADIGNNNGSRTNLRVYRVSLNELLDPGTTTIMADTIRFTYDLQTDFTPALNNNDWDCEALIAVDDSLYLFSKNWVSGTCYRYRLPAIPGDHIAQRLDTLDTQGMVTGATHDPGTGRIALIGYTNTFYQPFAWLLADYPGRSFFAGTAVRRGLSAAFTQFEGISWVAPGIVWLSNEQNMLNAARLWELALDLPTGDTDITHAPLEIWPVPNDGNFNVRAERPSLLELRNVQDSIVWTQQLHAGRNAVRIADLAAGIYTLYIDARSVQRMVVQH